MKNEIQSENENEAVKVIVRCRPMNQKELGLNSKVVVTMDTNKNEVCIANPNDSAAPHKKFTFDGVYYMDSTTEQIYTDMGENLVEDVLKGYNGTIFAYGQTGCGKSFTMQGVPDNLSQKGIIPRAFEHIFESISVSDAVKYLVHASYLEIYNEEIRDLLGNDAKKKLDLKEHPDKGVYIPDLSLHPVHDVKECERIMEKGWKNRSVGKTLMNADSSRSHSVFTVSIETLSTNDECGGHIRQGKLNLVDLAGSERQAKTGATGDRLKEATKINLSLSALGNVISALAVAKSKHIPYRDSKLTRLLEDSLGGNAKTLMVACLSPADYNYDESLSTLRYANRAKNIKNKPKINEDPKDALMREYQEEIRRLKAMLASGEAAEVTAPSATPQQTGVEGAENSQTAVIEEEKERLKTEYEQMMQELRQKYDEEQRSNAKLQEDVQRLRQQYENDLKQLNAQANIQKQHSSTTTHNEAQEGTETNTESNNSSSEVAPEKPNMNLDEALKRLHELEEQMVGGEKVHDKELKERRMRKKKAAEKRLRVLTDALHQVDEDDKAMLKVYDNIQEELKAKTDLLKKEKQRVRALEREIKDLQSEFEFDRMDYLETIRRQDQQIRLLQQILDKIQPCLRRDCNYINLDRVKGDSIWDEDQQKWRLPDLVIIKTKLPPAGTQPGGRVAPLSGGNAPLQPTTMVQNGNNAHHLLTTQISDDAGEDKFLQKLERGEQEDIAGNYFRSKRAHELLNKVKEDTQRLSNIRNNNNNFLYNTSVGLRENGSLNSSLNGGGGGGGGGNSYFGVANSGSPLMVNGTAGGSANGGGNFSSGPNSPEINLRKPMRLEALPLGDVPKKAKRKKNGFPATNTGTVNT